MKKKNKCKTTFNLGMTQDKKWIVMEMQIMVAEIWILMKFSQCFLAIEVALNKIILVGQIFKVILNIND